MSTKYIFANIVVSCAFVAQLFLFSNYFSVRVPIKHLISAFFMVYAAYHYLRNIEDIRINKKFLILIIHFFIALILVFQDMVGYRYITLLVILGLVFFYQSLMFSHLVRGNFLLKPIVIALCWMLLQYFYTLHFSMVFYTQQFLFIAALTLPFDISTHLKDRIITLPKKIGVNNSLYVIVCLLIVYAALGYFTNNIFFASSVLEAAFVIALLQVKFLLQERYVFVFDAVIILQTIIYLILSAAFTSSSSFLI